MKKKLTTILTVLLLIFFVLTVGLATMLVKRYMPSKDRMDGQEYFNLENENEAALVVNHNLEEEKVLVLDGRYYVEDTVVGKYINSRFYWDNNQKAMMYTLPTEVFMIMPDTTEYMTSQGKQVMDYMILRSYGDSFYLDLEFIQKFTDMDYRVYEDPAHVVIETDWSPVKVATVRDPGVIRQKGGIKSLIVDDVEAGEDVRILEEMENWTKIATDDGYTGYIQNKLLSDMRERTTEREKQELEYTNIKRDHKINLAWHQVTSQSGNETLAEMTAEAAGLNTISPTWFSVIDNAGTISSLASKEYVDQAHAMGMEVWGLIDNFNKDTDTMVFLSDTFVRGNIINQLLSEAERTGMDGINLDFEGITEEQGPHYVQFIRELSIGCRKNGLVFSVDNPVPMPYTQHYNRKEQGIVADYVIVMGYDEHHVGDQEAGSVASLNFVKNGIVDTLKEVPADKVINAIPFYTRLWKEPYGGGNVTSQVLGMDGTAEYLQTNGVEAFWDEKAGQNVAYFENEENIESIWIEDEQSIGEKMKLIQEYELAGVASWKLGFERASVWEIILQYLQ